MRFLLSAVAALALTGACVSNWQRVDADHLVSETGTIPLEGIRALGFTTKDGFRVSAGLTGELVVNETQVCGPLSLYRATPDAPSPSWAPPSSEYQRFQPLPCIDRGNIAKTEMNIRQTDAVASASCIALLPLCIIGHGVPGQ